MSASEKKEENSSSPEEKMRALGLKRLTILQDLREKIEANDPIISFQRDDKLEWSDIYDCPVFSSTSPLSPILYMNSFNKMGIPFRVHTGHYDASGMWFSTKWKLLLK